MKSELILQTILILGYSSSILKLNPVSADKEAHEKCKMEADDSSAWNESLFPENYRTLMPPLIEGKKTPINISINVHGIPKMNIEEMSLTLDFNLKLTWRDCRLVYVPPVNATIVPTKVANRLWIPSVIVSNGIGVEPIRFQPNKHEITLNNNAFSFLTRNKFPFYCSYDLSAYPMDLQWCELRIMSEDYRTTELLYPMDKIAASILKDREPPEYEVKALGYIDRIETDEHNQEYKSLGFYVVLDRRLLYHIISTYIPSILVVVLSWISFWISADAMAPRATIGLTSLLTMATQFANVQKNLPPVSYIKAIDVWMFACIVMVFSTLIESAVANYYSASSSKPLSDIKSKFSFTNNNKVPKNAYSSAMKPGEASNKKKQKLQQKIDKYSQIVFPLWFLVFNVCYWSYYMSLS